MNSKIFVALLFCSMSLTLLRASESRPSYTDITDMYGHRTITFNNGVRCEIENNEYRFYDSDGRRIPDDVVKKARMQQNNARLSKKPESRTQSSSQ